MTLTCAYWQAWLFGTCSFQIFEWFYLISPLVNCLGGCFLAGECVCAARFALCARLLWLTYTLGEFQLHLRFLKCRNTLDIGFLHFWLHEYFPKMHNSNVTRKVMRNIIYFQKFELNLKLNHYCCCCRLGVSVWLTCLLPLLLLLHFEWSGRPTPPPVISLTDWHIRPRWSQHSGHSGPPPRVRYRSPFPPGQVRLPRPPTTITERRMSVLGTPEPTGGDRWNGRPDGSYPDIKRLLATRSDRV